MHPRIAETLGFLDTKRAELAALVASIPEARRSRRPASGGWSPAEVLAHLSAVERRIGRLITAKIRELRQADLGPETDTSPVAPTVDLAKLLNRERKLTASDATQPPRNIDWDSTWRELQSQREALKATVVAADGLSLGRIVAPNPVLGSINLYQWLLFVGGHEGRHLEQIREAIVD